MTLNEGSSDVDGGVDNLGLEAGGDDTTTDKTPPVRDGHGRPGQVSVVPEVDVTSDMRERDTRCGLFSWKPWLLQKCNHRRVMLAVMCWFSAIQGFAVNGINNVNTTSLERRFFLTSTQVSLVSSSYDIAAGLFVIPIGYYGRLGHKPRWLAFAALAMSLGSFTMTLPHFVTSQYIAETNVTDTCPADNSTTCDDSGMSNYLYVFMGGQFLHGVGGTTLYTLGITYLDENVKMHHAPIYIGIFEAFAAIGPALGYLIGGLFLDIYVDFDTVPADQITIDSTDPRWVGAWWIGFLITAVGFLTISFMMFLFGFELPEAAENRKSRVSQAHADGSEEKFARPDFGMKLKDLPYCSWLLLKNPAFVFLTAAGVLSSLCSAGLATFLPKFIQTQFSVSPSWSALLTGFVVIPAGIVGQLAGGVIPGKMKWGVRAIMRYMGVVMLVSTFTIPAFLIRCDSNIMAGVTHQYKNSSQLLVTEQLSATCNAGCNCTKAMRDPVCDTSNVEFFSACYAGCTNSTTYTNGTKVFTGCLCSDSPTLEATSGGCESNCTLLPLFLFMLFAMVVGVMVCIPSGVVASIRCVPDHQGAYALALQWLFVRFLATIPGPILYGAIVDLTCIVWQDRCETADGSCWQYNQQNLAINFMSLTICVCVLIVISYFLAQWFYKPPPDTDTCNGAESDLDGGVVTNDKNGDVGVLNPAFEKAEESDVVTKF